MSRRSLTRVRKALAQIDEEIAQNIRQEAKKKKTMRSILKIGGILLACIALIVPLIPSVQKMANILPIVSFLLPSPESGEPILMLEEIMPLGKGRLKCVLHYRNSNPEMPIVIDNLEIIEHQERQDFIFSFNTPLPDQRIVVELDLQKTELPQQTSLSMFITDQKGYQSNTVIANDIKIF